MEKTDRQTHEGREKRIEGGSRGRRTEHQRMKGEAGVGREGGFMTLGGERRGERGWKGFGSGRRRVERRRVCEGQEKAGLRWPLLPFGGGALPVIFDISLTFPPA